MATRFLGKNALGFLSAKRPAWSHKGDFGRLLVVGGSVRFHGSSVFNCLSAYAAGCDLVFLVAPQRAADLAATFSPSMITRPLEGKYFSQEHVNEVFEIAQDYAATAFLVGGGMWRKQQTMHGVRELIRLCELPLVVDADAIRAVAGDPSILKGKKCILTPHSEEFRVLAGDEKKPSMEMETRGQAVELLAKKLGATIVLKGHVDIISDGKSTAYNKTGSPFMTKGGFGDCLAGIAGAFLARGLEPYDAACAAAYLNGLAGELAAKEKGESTMPVHAIEKIPLAISNSTRA